MNTPAEAIRIRDAEIPAEYPLLLEIWRSAVLATHDFLDAADLARIERALIPGYFPAVRLIVAERSGRVLGFAGIADDGLEMLFVAAEARGTGIGSALLTAAVAEHGVTRVDVNEQNTGALGFYLGRGFHEVGRSPVDGDGRPYPILHLRRR